MHARVDPVSHALRHAQARIAELEQQLVESKRETARARLEASQWKRRCYPTAGEVKRRLTSAKVEAWLDRNLCRVEPTDRWAKRWPTWQDDVAGVEYQATWRIDDVDKAAVEIAELIELVADGRGLDQWELLEQIEGIVIECGEQLLGALA